MSAWGACFMRSIFITLPFSLMLYLTTGASSIAQVPVTPVVDQLALLRSADTNLAFNKRLVFDFWRVVLDAHHIEETDRYLAENYIQHNPTVTSGRNAFKDFIGKRPRREIAATIATPLVAMMAEGNSVTLAFMISESDPCVPGRNYTTTRFDMFRIDQGKIVEHWDDARLGVPVPGGERPCLNAASAAKAGG